MSCSELCSARVFHGSLWKSFQVNITSVFAIIPLLVLIKKNSFCKMADFCDFLNILTAMISFQGQVRNEGSMAEWLGRWFEICRVQVSRWLPVAFVPGSLWFNSLAALVHNQLVCLLPLGILNLLSWFEYIVLLALKSPRKVYITWEMMPCGRPDRLCSKVWW